MKHIIKSHTGFEYNPNTTWLGFITEEYPYEDAHYALVYIEKKPITSSTDIHWAVGANHKDIYLLQPYHFIAYTN
jgi:hypothetical protein